MQENDVLETQDGVCAEVCESREDGENPTESGEIFDINSDKEALAEEIRGIEDKDLCELVNEARYAELRALGLSAKEAFLATAKRESVIHDNKSHLGRSIPRSVHTPSSAMSTAELIEARELFGNLSDEEIKKLYNKVTNQR